MIKNNILLTTLLLLFLQSTAIIGYAQNNPPKCTVKNLEPYNTVEQGEEIEVNLDVDDYDGYITSVRVFRNEIAAGSINEFPYNYTISFDYETTGLQKFKFIAIDNDGSRTSCMISFNIKEPKGSCPGTPIVKDIDGNIYHTVQIGDQCWMKENLRTTRYADGRRLKYVEDNDDWDQLNRYDGAYCYFENNNNNEYGALYTFAAATELEVLVNNDDIGGVQGICPYGWEVPNYGSYMKMINYLIEQARGSDFSIGFSLSEWNNRSYGIDTPYSNTSGFSGKFGGSRHSDGGSYFNQGKYGSWWLASYDNSRKNAIDFHISIDGYYGNSWERLLALPENWNSFGKSVRCIKSY